MAVLARLLPAVDRPPVGAARSALWFLLLCDAAILIFLPHSAAIAVAVSALAIATLAGSRISRAIALLVAGYPFFDPIVNYFENSAPVFASLRIILLGAAVWMIVSRVRRPGSLLTAFLSDPLVICSWILGLLIALGLLYTPSPNYGRAKVIAYFATDLPLLIAGYLLARRHDPESQARPNARIVSLLRWIGALSLALSAVAIANALLQFYPYGTRLTVLGLNPIWLGRIMGIGVIAFLSLFDCGRIRGPWALLLSAPLLTVLLLTGSRGPLLSLFLVVMMRMLVFTTASRARRTGFLLSGLAVCAMIFFAMPEEFRNRYLHPLTVDPSGIVRLRFFEIARGALSHVAGWGTGTGGFSDLVGKGDFRLYPHNVFAEVGIENGFLGLLALVGMLAIAASRGFRAARDPLTLAAVLGFLLAFFNAQFSGDLMYNEWVWLYAGLIAGRTR